MIDPNDPPRGSMFLYDAMLPATDDGSYQATVASQVTYPGDDANHTPVTQTLSLDRHFDVVGPRFQLAPTDVSNVYPPRNSVGGFHDALPQIVIKRRTLPWERPLDAKKPIPPAKHQPGDPPPPNGDPPWVALLLFEDGEYTFYQNLPLEQVVPSDVFNRLGSPSGIMCDAVEADSGLLAGIMPSKEELQMLAHVRQVNVEDRELNADTSDGFFSVVISNRLPAPGTKLRACLVSLEERSDLVPSDPPPFAEPSQFIQVSAGAIEVGVIGAHLEQAPAAGISPALPVAAAGEVVGPVFVNVATGIGSVRDQNFTTIVGNIHFTRLVRLVVLHSWQFTCTAGGTFREITQALNVGMVGTVASPGHPPITDTGHLRLPITDRAGAPEVAWYRGPLTPWQLTRDPLGPYHSADQARRATPETGAEDISYAAALEVGRLLAAADARLAQELMRWRRESYKQAARADCLTAIGKAIAVDLPGALAERLHTVLTPILATSAVQSLVNNPGPLTDSLGLNLASKTVGMDPASLSTAWGLASVLEAQQILGGNAATAGAPIAPITQTPRADTTIDQVAADTATLNALGTARANILTNTAVKLARSLPSTEPPQ